MSAHLVQLKYHDCRHGEVRQEQVLRGEDVVS